MHDYYSRKLSADRLRRCYEIAPPRVKRYFEAELQHVLDMTGPTDRVLELGCGYGRAVIELAVKPNTIIGIDTSLESLEMGRELLGGVANCHLAQMNALQLGFVDQTFDVVACIQNGISAFRVERRELVLEAVRVTRSGGTVLFSSYAERFWDDRLDWFRIQSEHGLIGEIDEDATGNGTIVCHDGFRAETVGADDFRGLVPELTRSLEIREVDGSSIFFELKVE
jgi:2-polyprenyl-6-hydroxyphenyl methylase/3-demethylubiquinone-9 3-methyltransferase